MQIVKIKNQYHRFTRKSDTDLLYLIVYYNYDSILFYYCDGLHNHIKCSL